MSASFTVDCSDGTIEIAPHGESLTLRSQGNPRMPTSVSLTPTECQKLIDALRAAIDHGWSVWRQGDDGNAFMLASGLSQADADEMVQEFELKKHKQLYWASQRVDIVRAG